MDASPPSAQTLRALDAVNFLMADVLTGVGPFLAVYLSASLHWAPDAIGLAMSAGGIATTLPFVHREAVKALKATYPSQDAGVGEISRTMWDFYRSQQPQIAVSRGPEIDRAVLAVQDIYRRNVFPDMNVRFGTYANNIGHLDSPGCFRCHDDDHKSKDGKKIGQDCDTCHAFE